MNTSRCFQEIILTNKMTLILGNIGPKKLYATSTLPCLVLLEFMTTTFSFSQFLATLAFTFKPGIERLSPE